MALEFVVEGQRKGGQKKTRKKQVVEESMKAGLSVEGAHCWLKWIVVVDQSATGMRRNWPPSPVGDTTRF